MKVVCVCVTMLYMYDSQELVLHLMHLPVVILNQRRERKTGAIRQDLGVC